MANASIIQKLKAYFEKQPEVVMAFLFGSQASGRARKVSDWDIAVYLTKEDDKIESAIWREVERIVKTEVDLVILNRAKTHVADMAIRGIPLIIKDRRFFIEFILTLTREAEDFRNMTKEYAQIYWRSTSLIEQDADALQRRLVFLDSELRAFPEYSKITWIEYQDDPHKRRQVERFIENLMNAAIDIAKIILASQKRPIPSTYKEALQLLGVIEPFSPEITEQLSRWADLRNILAHEYLDLQWRPIHAFLKEAQPIPFIYYRS